LTSSKTSSGFACKLSFRDAHYVTRALRDVAIVSIIYVKKITSLKLSVRTIVMISVH